MTLGMIDKLQKVSTILSERFETQYDLPRDVSVDEAMIPYKGRLGYKQYMKAKPIKWGIKVFVLASAANGYIHRFNIYTGKQAEGDEPEHGLCTQSVIDLMRGHEGKGHVVYTDNYYTSPELYTYLEERQIYGCGTCMTNRKGYPKDFAKKNLPKEKTVERGYYRNYSKGPLLAAMSPSCLHMTHVCLMDQSPLF